MSSKEELYLMGMDQFADDEIDGAIETLQKAVEIDDTYGDALHALGMCFYHKKDYASAIKYGEMFKQAEPQNTLAYTSLSMFYMARGMIAKAEEMGALAGAQPPPTETEES
jgi:restriction system protein